MSVVVRISWECPLLCGTGTIASWDGKKRGVIFHGGSVS